jgi:hypothetical protein
VCWQGRAAGVGRGRPQRGGGALPPGLVGAVPRVENASNHEVAEPIGALTPSQRGKRPNELGKAVGWGVIRVIGARARRASTPCAERPRPTIIRVCGVL